MRGDTMARLGGRRRSIRYQSRPRVSIVLARGGEAEGQRKEERIPHEDGYVKIFETSEWISLIHVRGASRIHVSHRTLA